MNPDIPEVREIMTAEAYEREEEILLNGLERLAADRIITPAELERLGAWLGENNGDRGAWGTKEDVRVFHDTIAQAWERIRALGDLLRRAVPILRAVRDADGFLRGTHWPDKAAEILAALDAEDAEGG